MKTPAIALVVVFLAGCTSTSDRQLSAPFVRTEPIEQVVRLPQLDAVQQPLRTTRGMQQFGLKGPPKPYRSLARIQTIISGRTLDDTEAVADKVAALGGNAFFLIRGHIGSLSSTSAGFEYEAVKMIEPLDEATKAKIDAAISAELDHSQEADLGELVRTVPAIRDYLEVSLVECESVVNWCRRNPGGGSISEAAGRLKYFTAEEAGRALANAGRMHKNCLRALAVSKP